MLTNETLKKIYPHSSEKNRHKFLPYLNQYMMEYNINTVERQAAFLAQIGHESAQLAYTEEIASGRIYEGRRDLGNIEKGDGMKYKGRGLLQITGRHNYLQLDNLISNLPMGTEFITNPELLREPLYATLTACWWWHNRKLNKLADTPSEENFKKITKIINGGYNGYQNRHKLWLLAKQHLSL